MTSKCPAATTIDNNVAALVEVTLTYSTASSGLMRYVICEVCSDRSRDKA